MAKVNHKPKLSQIQLNEAYDLYYNHPHPLTRPTLAALATIFHVSTNTMFVHLNREKHRRDTEGPIDPLLNQST